MRDTSFMVQRSRTAHLAGYYRLMKDKAGQSSSLTGAEVARQSYSKLLGEFPNGADAQPQFTNISIRRILFSWDFERAELT